MDFWTIKEFFVFLFARIMLVLILLLLLPEKALSGVQSQHFFTGSLTSVPTALKDPAIRLEIISKTLIDPGLKQKAKAILRAHIKGAKTTLCGEHARSFYREMIGLPRKINGRTPINSMYASKIFRLSHPLKSKYPHGIPFTTQGFPDFSRYALKKTDIALTGNRKEDFLLADVRAGISEAFRKSHKLTWHHHENGRTMLLIDTELHQAVRHTGGFAA